MSNNNLLERFKKQYEEGTSFKVGRHFFDKDGNLKVVIENATGKNCLNLQLKNILMEKFIGIKLLKVI